MEATKQSDLIRTALEGARSIVDANTIIGSTITTSSGATIIPVSKIFVGLASGGIDFLDKKGISDKKNFGGGGGTGITVSPIAFVVIKKDGSVDLLNVYDEPKDALGYILNFIEDTPELIDKFRKLIFKKQENS